jgi:hypothetical protein
MSQPPDDNLKALWRGQETETTTMTVEAIRALARNHGAHVRDKFLMGAVLVAIEALFFGVMAWRAPNNVARVGDVMVLAGLAWMIWRLQARLPGSLPAAGASAETLIDFHRAELQRQGRGYGDLMLIAGPMILGLLVLIYGMALTRPEAGLRNVGPILVLLGVWFVAAWFVQRRQARGLQDQIEELDRMRGE